MSQRLPFTKPNNLDDLHDQLVAGGIPVERVEGQGDRIWVTVPDDVDAKAVRAIVDAHVPAPTTVQPNPLDALLAQAEAAPNSALKAVIVGLLKACREGTV